MKVFEIICSSCHRTILLECKEYPMLVQCQYCNSHSIEYNELFDPYHDLLCE
jgi:uncharacterized CHY-type Zn-finger protein